MTDLWKEIQNLPLKDALEQVPLCRIAKGERAVQLTPNDVGKKFKTRDGKVVTLRKWDDTELPAEFSDCFWRFPSGHICSEWETHSKDIVERIGEGYKVGDWVVNLQYELVGIVEKVHVQCNPEKYSMSWRCHVSGEKTAFKTGIHPGSELRSATKEEVQRAENLEVPVLKPGDLVEVLDKPDGFVERYSTCFRRSSIGKVFKVVGLSKSGYCPPGSVELEGSDFWWPPQALKLVAEEKIEKGDLVELLPWPEFETKRGFKAMSIGKQVRVLKVEEQTWPTFGPMQTVCFAEKGKEWPVEFCRLVRKAGQEQAAVSPSKKPSSGSCPACGGEGRVPDEHDRLDAKHGIRCLKCNPLPKKELINGWREPLSPRKPQPAPAHVLCNGEVRLANHWDIHSANNLDVGRQRQAQIEKLEAKKERIERKISKLEEEL